MATFQEQVQDLTSLTVSDTDELSQFLKDGVLDVTNKWLAVRPQDAELFIRVSAEQTANDSLALNGVKIINVVREDGTNNQWRKCRKIDPSLQYDVTDKESLRYASKINPAYTLLHNGKINVFPSADTGGADSFKVYYVNNEPTDLTNNALLIHSHSDIQYFPADKVYLVVLYAGIKLIQAELGSIANLTITTVPPDVPSLSSGNSVSFGHNAPTYDNTIANTEITDEDIDLATIKIQNELNEFNEEMAAYQAQLQVSLKNADIDNQEDARLVQKYQAEVAAYQADVQKEVQEHTGKIQGLQVQYTWLTQEYGAAFGIAAPKAR